MKKDRKDEFLDAMGNTDELNIAEYQRALRARRRRLLRIIATVALACLVTGAVAVAIMLGK